MEDLIGISTKSERQRRRRQISVDSGRGRVIFTARSRPIRFLPSREKSGASPACTSAAQGCGAFGGSMSDCSACKRVSTGTTDGQRIRAPYLAASLAFLLISLFIGLPARATAGRSEERRVGKE